MAGVALAWTVGVASAQENNTWTQDIDTRVCYIDSSVWLTKINCATVFAILKNMRENKIPVQYTVTRDTANGGTIDQINYASGKTLAIIESAWVEKTCVRPKEV